MTNIATYIRDVADVIDADEWGYVPEAHYAGNGITLRQAVDRVVPEADPTVLAGPDSGQGWLRELVFDSLPWGDIQHGYDHHRLVALLREHADEIERQNA